MLPTCMATHTVAEVGMDGTCLAQHGPRFCSLQNPVPLSGPHTPNEASCPGEDGSDPDFMELGIEAPLSERGAPQPEVSVYLLNQGTLQSDPAGPAGSSVQEVEEAVRNLQLCLDPGPPGQLQWRPGSAGAVWWGRRVAAHGLGTGPASYLLHSGDVAEPWLSPSCSPPPASCSPHAAEHLAPPRVRLNLCMLMPGTQAPFLFPLL
ncbi:polo like kinase 5 (inactive) [Phyllostomus discolor]|uniref:Polo like kinase 5 (Inactive) n=1 Tax=Phyllostomus discolor TaxID=89673 RepID=A0A833ZP62_9CHIR|nr:polo like kinase 5 (inactive) [Phyllostomus discolor]